MNSKQELENIIRKAERKRYEYLKAMFRYVPDAIVKQMSYRQFKKDEYMIYAKTPCDTIYVIVSGDVAGVDYQKQGHVSGIFRNIPFPFMLHRIRGLCFFQQRLIYSGYKMTKMRCFYESGTLFPC